MTNVLMALKDGSLVTVPFGSGIPRLRGTMLLLSVRRSQRDTDTQEHPNPVPMQEVVFQRQVPPSVRALYRVEVSDQGVLVRARLVGDKNA